VVSDRRRIQNVSLYPVRPVRLVRLTHRKRNKAFANGGPDQEASADLDVSAIQMDAILHDVTG